MLKQGFAAVGVIGVGMMGGHHVRNLALHVHNADLLALAEADKERLQWAADEFGVPHRFTDPQDLINHPQIDGILIAAPDRFHAALAASCIQAGKPVLVEKPLATDSGAALEVVRMEEASGRRLVQVGFMRQYDPAHIAVKDRVDQGDLGRTMAFRNLHASYSPGLPPRGAGEVMFNSLIHEFHTARWMMGEEVTQVFAQALPWPNCPGSARFSTVQLSFQSGALGILAYNDLRNTGIKWKWKLLAKPGLLPPIPMRFPWLHSAAKSRKR